MMMDKLLSIGLEMAVLAGIAGLYYLWQRHRILHGPRHWQSDKLDEAHHLAVSCDTPERHRDLVPFIEACEKRLNSEQAFIDGEFLERWKHSELPENVRELLSDCSEWWDQSHPKTR